MQLSVVVVSMFLLNALVSPICLAQNQVSARPLRPLVVLSGADSHIKKPFYKRVTEQKECSSIWANHLGTTADDAYRAGLEANFDACMIVMIFLGDQTNVRGVDVHASSETKDSIVIRVHEVTYQTAGELNKKPPDRPYALIAIPRSNKRIVIELDVQNELGEPPLWKEIARL